MLNLRKCRNKKELEVFGILGLTFGKKRVWENGLMRN
jgi:hypothetical protein